MRKEVEVLEDHTHLLTEMIQVYLAVGDDLTIHFNGAVCRFFQKVQTSEEGGFTRAGGADDDHNIAGIDIQIYTVQSTDRTIVIVFFKTSDLDQCIIVCHLLSSSSRNTE